MLGLCYFLTRPVPQTTNRPLRVHTNGLITQQDEDKEEENEEEEFSAERLEHEYKMLRNPVTGTIPANIREIEARVFNSIPSRHSLNGTQATRTGDAANQNAYTSVGPNNIAGRIRTLAFDKRNANIVLTGGVTGGIFRSTDGGANWAFVSGENDVRSATSLAQDPINPDTWYCGTGEIFYPASAADIAGTVGFGIFKSNDNGASWTKLTATEDPNQHQFNGTFDLVHRMAVHPTTGHVYAAVHNRIMRSTDGGTTWATVLGTSGDKAQNGITELLIPSNGAKIFAAFSGSNANRSLAGVWESASGSVNSWRRIAGGLSGSSDSVAGWQPYGKWARVVLGLNNANNKLFVLYQNGKSATGSSPQPEADLFRADITSGNPNTYTWTNLNAYVPDEANYNREGVDPFTTQFFGYNMSIAVKPDNDNILFIGGTVLDRVDLTRTTASQKFRRIGGYGVGFFSQSENFIYPNHHPDVHGIYFPPGATDLMYTVTDGGVQKTTNSTLADTVRWQELNTNLQTLQYQFVNIHPDLDANFIIGGAQDNGTTASIDSRQPLAHESVQGGDGASAAFSQFSKSGNTWRQYMYTSVVQGYIERANLTWQLVNNDLELRAFDRTEITPNGLADNEGQWLTLFVNDPDSTNHLYYNWQNKLFRTRSASSVTPSTWTEFAGFPSVLGSGVNGSAMAISKSRDGVKYLYLGTENGKLYRLNNAALAPESATPISITPPTMATGSYVAGISINPRSPDTLLVVVSNYDSQSAPVNNIFWTGNATAASPTWQVLDGALSPVSVQSCAIVLKNSGIEYYVGTSIGLYSATTLAGTSTQWFNEGSGMLKKAIVRSLVNRQKDNTLVVGTHGNGAFMAKIGDAVTLGNDVVTGINDPITNDRNFIRQVYPTLANNEVFFNIGHLLSVRSIMVQLYGVRGQKLYEVQQGYQNGSVNISKLPKGAYILQITSSDGRYRHVQKILKQ